VRTDDRLFTTDVSAKFVSHVTQKLGDKYKKSGPIKLTVDIVP